VGKEADLIMVNLKQPHLTPHNDLFSALVYSAQASDVSTVLCQGKILMENRILTGYDVDSLLEDTEARWASVLSR
jgi:5-methylthioadenosine/S-adenosylhomocysteine deaminase